MLDELDAAFAIIDRVITNDARRNVFHLPQRMIHLLAMLMASEVVPTETIDEILKFKSGAKIAVHRLRGYLQPYGVIIKSVRSTGYYLESDMKNRVRQFITCGVTPTGTGFDPAERAVTKEMEDVVAATVAARAA
jgi:hypothetical protein